MLNGKRAFQKPTSAETMAAILNEDQPPTSQIGVQIPLALDRIVQHCLEKNQAQRSTGSTTLKSNKIFRVIPQITKWLHAVY